MEEYPSGFLPALWSACGDASSCIYLSRALNQIPFLGSLKGYVRVNCVFVFSTQRKYVVLGVMLSDIIRNLILVKKLCSASYLISSKFIAKSKAFQINAAI